MLPLKLLIAGLVASAIGLAMFALSFASLNTDVNVLALAAHNSGGTLAHAANLPVNSSDELGLGDSVTGTITGTITNTLTLTGTNKIVEAITNYFSSTLTSTVSISAVVALRDDGWGFGEIFRLYELAKESGKTPDEIKAMRDSGMGWGEIAKALDQSPGNKGNNLGAAVSGRGISGTLTITPTNTQNNSRGNPQGGPPGLGGVVPGRGITGTLSTTSPSTQNKSQGNPQGGPPGKSEGGPPGKSKNKGK